MSQSSPPKQNDNASSESDDQAKRDEDAKPAAKNHLGKRKKCNSDDKDIDSDDEDDDDDEDGGDDDSDDDDDDEDKEDNDGDEDKKDDADEDKEDEEDEEDDDIDEIEDVVERAFYRLGRVSLRIQRDSRTKDEFKQACEKYNELLFKSVKEHPGLVTFNNPDDKEYTSLLYDAVENHRSEWSHPGMRFLIEKEPRSLLWDNNPHDEPIINLIARNSCHHVLMPWIAKEYSWILDKFNCGQTSTDEDLIDGSPDAGLVFGFENGTVTESVLRSFFEVYPRLLVHQGHGRDGDEYLPLHNILTSRDHECNSDFFQWMVFQNPSAMGLRKQRDNKTMLHCALDGLTIHKTENMAEICKFIVDNRPDLVQEKIIFDNFSFDNFRNKPFFSLAEQDVLTTLLDVYSEPFDLVTEFKYRRDHLVGLRNKSFRQLKSLLDERKDLKESMSLLHQGSNNLTVAIACSKKTFYAELSSAFRSWSELLTQQLEEKVNAIQIAIIQFWTKYEEEYHALVAHLNE